MPGWMEALPDPPELVLPSKPWLGNLLGTKEWPPALLPAALPSVWGRRAVSASARRREGALVLPDVASGICLVPALGLLSTIAKQKLLSLGRC